MNFDVISLLIYLVLRSEFASSCSATYSVQGQVLRNHTIKTETADKIEDCILRCMAYPGCTSSNFYRMDKRCELSDKTHASHPEDMSSNPYTVYMVNTFRPIPCKTQRECGMDLLCTPSLICEECRSHPLGMESRAIPNSAVTASSTWGAAHEPWQARLNNAPKSQSTGSWSAGTNAVGQWLQIDLGKETVLTKIATQSRPGNGQRVSSYKILFSLDGANWNAYRSDDSEKVFTGNSYIGTIVSHKLVPRITSRYVRFYVMSWYGHISMRVELYGCVINGP
ncbi:lactadherin-like isoform X1 [Montipora capricornis]|uniref:lactadherin-like isoform X1 n=1 Tax=Montipora capricornis TaxID=246305 RepID=UPI0035F19461